MKRFLGRPRHRRSRGDPKCPGRDTNRQHGCERDCIVGMHLSGAGELIVGARPAGKSSPRTRTYTRISLDQLLWALEGFAEVNLDRRPSHSNHGFSLAEERVIRKVCDEWGYHGWGKLKNGVTEILSERLGHSRGSIKVKICHMRRKGLFPKVDIAQARTAA
jgi:hypothetical protein